MLFSPSTVLLFAYVAGYTALIAPCGRKKQPSAVISQMVLTGPSMQHVLYLLLRRLRLPIITIISAYALSIAGFVISPGQRR